MALDFAASVTCDHCGQKKTPVRIVVTKLKPQPEMHLKLPPDWKATSLPESGDLRVTCPNCPSALVSVPPPPVEDPATDPTLRPPPKS